MKINVKKSTARSKYGKIVGEQIINNLLTYTVKDKKGNYIIYPAEDIEVYGRDLKPQISTLKVDKKKRK